MSQAGSRPTGTANDKFIVYAGKEVEVIKSFQIYSRWGEKVFECSGFEPNNPDYGWTVRTVGKN